MIAMTTPEIVELQANRESIEKLNETISANSKEERREFEDLFKQYVTTDLKTIADNTSKMVGTVPLSTEQPDYDNP
jgi:hypothetical protein